MDVSETKLNMLGIIREGIEDFSSGTLWEFPIFIGKMNISLFNNEEVLIEISKEGNKYFLIFSDIHLGMIAKAKLAMYYVIYLIRELISRQGKISRGNNIPVKIVGQILSRGLIEVNKS